LQERERIERARNGDQSSLEELLQQNYSILKGYLIKATLDPELAADLTQETMVKAIRQIKQFKGQSKFSTWLISIGSNLYRDHLRKNRRLIVTEDLDLLAGETELKGLRIEIDELLEKLPQEKRMVLILKHYFGYTYEEIGKILGCPVGTVKSRMYYCMDFLQKQWERGRSG
jgi:RNA polymerase sigma-70 factor (ECF subfamily)